MHPSATDVGGQLLVSQNILAIAATAEVDGTALNIAQDECQTVTNQRGHYRISPGRTSIVRKYPPPL
jgi:hypothetical protein